MPAARAVVPAPAPGQAPPAQQPAQAGGHGSQVSSPLQTTTAAGRAATPELHGRPPAHLLRRLQRRGRLRHRALRAGRRRRGRCKRGSDARQQRGDAVAVCVVVKPDADDVVASVAVQAVWAVDLALEAAHHVLNKVVCTSMGVGVE